MEAQSSQPLGAGQVTDDALIRLWLHGRAENTVKAYRRDIDGFLRHAGKPIAAVTLADLQAWDDSLSDHAASSRARRLAAVKSLLAFGLKVGVLPIDVGRALRVEKPTSTAAERILTEAEVSHIIAGEQRPYARVVLRVLYAAGLRASELANLCRRDMTPRGKAGGEIRVLGKGSKLRTIKLPASVWREIEELGGSVRLDAPAIPRPDGSALDRQAVFRIVRHAARRAGLGKPVSPHWLRHSHASHALDRQAPIHVVRENMGHASLATTTRYLHARKGESSADYLSLGESAAR